MRAAHFTFLSTNFTTLLCCVLCARLCIKVLWFELIRVVLRSGLGSRCVTSIQHRRVRRRVEDFHVITASREGRGEVKCEICCVFPLYYWIEMLLWHFRTLLCAPLSLYDDMMGIIKIQLRLSRWNEWINSLCCEAGSYVDVDVDYKKWWRLLSSFIECRWQRTVDSSNRYFCVTFLMSDKLMLAEGSGKLRVVLGWQKLCQFLLQLWWLRWHRR